MKISNENAERLGEIATEMAVLLDEYKNICRRAMEPQEYQQFKYRTLGHIEPVLNDDSEWVTKYSSLDSLAKVAAGAVDDASPDEEEEEITK